MNNIHDNFSNITLKHRYINNSTKNVTNEKQVKISLFNNIYNNIQYNPSDAIKNFLEKQENYNDFTENEQKYMQQNNLDRSKYVPYNVYAMTWYDFFNKLVTNIKDLFGDLQIAAESRQKPGGGYADQIRKNIEKARER